MSAVPNAGLFGTALATMGMLGTAVYILATDTFGATTDNAAEKDRTLTRRPSSEIPWETLLKTRSVPVSMC